MTHPYRSDLLVTDFTFSLNFCLVAGLGLTQFLMTCESKHELQKKAKYLLLSECRSLLAIKINLFNLGVLLVSERIHKII